MAFVSFIQSRVPGITVEAAITPRFSPNLSADRMRPRAPEIYHKREGWARPVISAVIEGRQLVGDLQVGFARYLEEVKSTMTSSLWDRSQYPCLCDSVYLNQASLGLIGQPAVAAMHSFLENVARHGNLYMSDSDEINYCHALRGVAGRLFHNDPSRIAILAGASELLGQFPLLFRLKPNATILAVSSDFPAITRPWVRQSYLEKIRVRFVDDLPDRDLTDTIIDAIDETTGVIAVSSVQYSTGTLVDVRRLARSAKKVGAFLIVDATQAAGAMRVDTSALEADVVTSGYKWLGGHGGVGLAAVSHAY